MADRFDEIARAALKDARDEHEMYDRCASALRDTHNAAEREGRIALMAELADPEPPSDEELRAIPPDVGTVPFGDSALRARYDLGFAMGRIAELQDVKRLVSGGDCAGRVLSRVEARLAELKKGT